MVEDITLNGHFASLSCDEDNRKGECHNTNNENKTLCDNAMRRSSFQLDGTESRNGYEREKINEICHPQHNLCLNDLDVETNKVVVESWPSGINKSGKMCNDSFNCSLQSPKSGEMIHHKTSNKKQRQNDSCCNISSFVICDIKQSPCFMKDASCTKMNDCQGYKQLIEAFPSPIMTKPKKMMMTSSIEKLETKNEYDTMTDEIITCSIYEV